MRSIVVTLDVSQDKRSWLKSDAPLNMLLISVTLDTSHEDRGLLKLYAPENMPCMVVALDVSHKLMSSLNKKEPRQNMQEKSCIWDTCHFPMGHP